VSSREEFLDYAHGFINVYDSLLMSRTNANEFRHLHNDDGADRGAWTAFRLAGYSLHDDAGAYYVARLLRGHRRSGLGIQICEFLSPPAPVEGMQPVPRQLDVLILEERPLRPSATGLVADEDDTEEDDDNSERDTESTSQSSQDREEEEES
jgi:hypothetical protein